MLYFRWGNHHSIDTNLLLWPSPALWASVFFQAHTLHFLNYSLTLLSVYVLPWTAHPPPCFSLSLKSNMTWICLHLRLCVCLHVWQVTQAPKSPVPRLWLHVTLQTCISSSMVTLIHEITLSAYHSNQKPASFPLPPLQLSTQCPNHPFLSHDYWHCFTSGPIIF